MSFEDKQPSDKIFLDRDDQISEDAKEDDDPEEPSYVARNVVNDLERTFENHVFKEIINDSFSESNLLFEMLVANG